MYFISIVFSVILGSQVTTSGFLLKRILYSTDTPIGTPKLFNYILIKYDIKLIKTRYSDNNKKKTLCLTLC